MKQKHSPKIKFTSPFCGFIFYENPSKSKVTSAIATTSILFFLLVFSPELIAQKSAKPLFSTYSKKGTGIGVVAADSLFSINFQFRMQNRAVYTSTSSTDLTPDKLEFRTRRMRMKFKGFVYSPKVTYYFQLALSRADMDWVNNDNSNVNSSPNILRDAVIYYAPTSRLRLSFGQTKLPGNRQRVTSSGDQQFYERSIV
ncbi:MAG TPA: porin, partial [Cyclobacteriaceae bacterium]